MELYQLRYFSYAAKCENISEASRRLMVAQSSVSKAITGLEAELQTNLFIRNGKHIRLSSNGRLFAAKVAPILSAAGDLCLRKGECGPAPRPLGLRAAP